MLIKRENPFYITKFLTSRKILFATLLVIIYSIGVAAVTAIMTRQGVVGNVIIPTLRTNVRVPSNYIEGLLTPADKLVIDIKHKNFLKIAHKRSEAVAVGARPSLLQGARLLS